MRTVAGMGGTSHERSRLDGYVPLEHPLRRVRAAIDAPLGALHQWLRVTCTPAGRCPVAPEQAVRALLLQFLFAIRRDRQLVDQIWYSMLFRWFVGVRLDEPKWDPDAFSAFSQQLLAHDAIRDVLLRGLTEAHRESLLSSEALTARRCALAQLTSEVAVGVGRPGVLPGQAGPQAGRARADSGAPARIQRC
jgi:transposase